jgi:Trehalose and maltose hydrolases (possible phosphorylases)
MNWTITNHSLDPDQLLVNESLFSLGNGYLGVRGNFEEGYAEGYPTIRGTYINAFHDLAAIHYGEKACGYPEIKQKLMNLIDAQGMKFYIDDELQPFSLFSGKVLHYERTLNLRRGFSERLIQWRSPKGREIMIRFRRLVSFVRRELLAVEVTLEPVDFTGMLTLVSTINGDVKNFSDAADSRVASADETHLDVLAAKSKDTVSIVTDRAHTSKLKVSCASSLTFSVPAVPQVTVTPTLVATKAKMGFSGPVTITKRSVYTDSLRHGEPTGKTALSLLEKLESVPFSELLKEQKDYLDRFWNTSDVLITGNQAMQAGIRFNLYHLLQSAGRDSVSSIAAKGLSGEGYEGHYFWDTEIFMLPFFTLTHPEIARRLLLYRYGLLDHARCRAREMGHSKGALFPWRTITGMECSAFFPAGTAQYHINADIAYSCVQYYLATGDNDFMADYGAEILFETARVWLEIGHYFKDSFRIDDVTGPDEYTAIVDNNYYTNAMAKYNLSWAAKTCRDLKTRNPDRFTLLSNRLGLSDSEADDWMRAAEAMYLPYDRELGINPQDDTFLQKAVWNFARTPAENYPLLLHYHPLTIYRYQVCKQADAVLAHFLLEDEENLETIRKSYHYYEKITTHDSSLSTCIFSIMAARLGDTEKAYDYFKTAARIDLDNTQGNTRDGLHLANIGGTWMAIVFGFAGVRIKESGLSLRPILPDAWKSYAFRLIHHGKLLAVSVFREQLKLQLLEGDNLRLRLYDQPVELVHGPAVSFPLTR